MGLRAALEPPLTLVEERLPVVIALINAFDEAYEAENADNISSIINEISVLTGKVLTEADFIAYWEAESIGEFAFRLSMPAAPYVAPISRSEIVEIIHRMRALDSPIHSQTFIDLGVPLAYLLTYDYYLPLLERNFSYPHPMELINRRKANNIYTELSSEEIADKLIAHQLS